VNYQKRINMKVLIVGCGAVGQVYGLSLQKVGVTLGFLDRPATVEKLKQALEHAGLPIYQISRSHRRDPIPYRLEHYQVVTDMAESQRFAPDQIWFTIPSQAYYTEWFKEFVQKVPSEQVVCFVPEGARPELFAEGMQDRLVFAGTTFMAWQGSLEGGGGRAEGVNFWLPPLSIPIVGSQEACREVGQLLKKAGFRVAVGRQGSHSQASTTALMTAFTAGLELSGWSLKAFRKSPWLKQAAAAAREAGLSQLPGAGVFQRALLGTPVLTATFFLVALVLPLIFPFDAESYLKFHYTKTREQTLTLLDIFARDAKSCQLPVGNILALRQALLGQL
jgi:ketopantoate reductase